MYVVLPLAGVDDYCVYWVVKYCIAGDFRKVKFSRFYANLRNLEVWVRDEQASHPRKFQPQKISLLLNLWKFSPHENYPLYDTFHFLSGDKSVIIAANLCTKWVGVFCTDLSTCSWRVYIFIHSFCCSYFAQRNYTVDYTQVRNSTSLNFQTVFAILFNGCTGIMGEQWWVGGVDWLINLYSLASHLFSLFVCLSSCLWAVGFWVSRCNNSQVPTCLFVYCIYHGWRFLSATNISSSAIPCCMQVDWIHFASCPTCNVMIVLWTICNIAQGFCWVRNGEDRNQFKIREEPEELVSFSPVALGPCSGSIPS